MEMVGRFGMEINRLRMEDAPPVFYGSSQKTDNKSTLRAGVSG
jgi:hypothetical protein